MDPKINVGELTIAEFNLVLKQLAAGQLGECIDLFMKLRQIGAEFQAKASGEPRMVPPPPAAE